MDRLSLAVAALSIEALVSLPPPDAIVEDMSSKTLLNTVFPETVILRLLIVVVPLLVILTCPVEVTSTVTDAPN